MPYFGKFTLLLSTLLGSLLLAPMATAQINFNHFQVNAPFNISQEPIRVNLLTNKGKEIIVIGDKDGQAKLALFAFDEAEQSYQLQVNVDLPKTLFAYDYHDSHLESEKQADLPLQHLYFLSSDSVVQFTPNNEQVFTDVADVESIYINQQTPYLRRLSFLEDINADGLDDIILPDFRTINVFINQDIGGFVRNSLPVFPTVEIFSNGITYTEQRYFLADANFDQKLDILLVENNQLVVYQQDNNSFETGPIYIDLKQPISGVNWWDDRGADGNSLDQSDLKHRMVERIEDINGDGIVDLVVRYTQSSGVLERQNDYEIYLGKEQNKQLVYTNKAHTTIKSEGTLAGLNIVDLNNDKQQEIVLSSFDISVSQIIGALLSGSVDQDVLIFSLDKNQTYKERVSKQVQLKFSLSSGKSGSPVVALADLNGDGVKDLILSSDDDELSIYPGNRKTGLVGRDYQQLDIRLPTNGVLLITDDLDYDGRDEMIIRYGSEDGESKQNRLLIVEAK
ncbi:VCBS repeat-containing protein [Thalassotalea crassostreae]|uniref:VCBS repeat-containing protein n=1 Tax=Thalassotalea crassostreae TaxID=1763536 RepID=UPI000837FAD2|nr:VCBS repeat-containing protein [Thalassotalea crassostreae]